MDYQFGPPLGAPTPLPRQRPVPLPTPDPRGSTFVQRIPQPDPFSFGPFQAGEIPTYALMQKLGINLNPDRLAIPPDFVLQQYFLRSMMGQKI